jgi:hypothetical protein
LWAQRTDRLYVTVGIPGDSQNLQINLEDAGKLTLSAEDGATKYHLELEFFDEISKEVGIIFSFHNTSHRTANGKHLEEILTSVSDLKNYFIT